MQLVPGLQCWPSLQFCCSSYVSQPFTNQYLCELVSALTTKTPVSHFFTAATFTTFHKSVFVQTSLTAKAPVSRLLTVLPETPVHIVTCSTQQRRFLLQICKPANYFQVYQRASSHNQCSGIFCRQITPFYTVQNY